MSDKAHQDWLKKQAACKCLTPKRRAFIQSKLDFAENFPDGAFMAFMEENNIDVGELEAFSLEHDCASGIGASRA